MDEKIKLQKKLERLEKQLEKVRGKEYEQGWQTSRRAKISRSWDMLAQEKFRTQQQLEEIEKCGL